MIVKVRASSLFGNMERSYEFINSVLGRPVTDGNRKIGMIVGYNDTKDLFSLDIDDDYKDRLMTNEICSCEIVEIIP